VGKGGLTDPPCSRNARLPKALVGRAQSGGFSQAVLLRVSEEKKRGRVASCHSCSRSAHEKNVLVRCAQWRSCRHLAECMWRVSLSPIRTVGDHL